MNWIPHIYNLAVLIKVSGAAWFIQSQLTFTCSKSTIKKLEKGMNYVQI